jgi:IS5 family transposase
MIRSKDRRQKELIEFISWGTEKHHKMLRCSIYHTFRKEILPNIPIHFFRKHFSAEFGRPTKDLQSIVGLFVLQALRDMTDFEAIEAYCFNDTFRYALDISRSEYLSERSYYYYRAKVMGEGSAVFNKILDSITKRLELDAALQRTDSTMVQVNLARMSKLELFSTTIKKFLTELRQAHPIIYGRLDQELRDRYLPAKDNSWFANNKPSQYKELLLSAAHDVLGLIERFRDHPSASQIPSFALLIRLAEEQIVSNDEEIVVQANKDTKGAAMTNPHDPDAHYNGHYKKVGYKADFTETCGKDKDTPHPKIVTQVSVHPANTSDKTTILGTVDTLESKGLKPQTLLADNGYDSDGNQQGCLKHDVELICPPSGAPADGFGVMDFVRTEDNTIISCPMGQQCTDNIVHSGRKRTVSHFDPVRCRECPHSHDCPVKITKRKARLEWDWKKPRIEARRRMFAEDAETKALYRQRAGGESAFSVTKRKLGLNRLRRRGREKATLSIFLAATALNVLRMHHWLVWSLFSNQFSKISGFLMWIQCLRVSFFTNWMKIPRQQAQACFY